MSRIVAMDFGKVRNTALLDDGRRILETTDRISAFDAVLPFDVPGKGAVLQALSLFFFEKTRDVVRNHVVGRLGARHLLCESARVFPVEFVVRGFLTGSLWRLYERGGPEEVFARYGVRIPPGLRAGAAFDEPLLTPTSKARTGHDEPLTHAECRDIVPNFDSVASVCRALFLRGQECARDRGLVLVDTKYELGLFGEELMLVDEIHTPDSSRYWLEADLGSENPRSLSKELFREIIIAMFGGIENIGLDFVDHPRFRDPSFVAELQARVAERYLEVLRLLTGHDSPDAIAARSHPWPVPEADFSRWERATCLPERILVCGNGGRDHAIASAFAALAEVRTVFFTPGDRAWGGKCRPLPVDSGASTSTIVEAAQAQGVGLVVVGPELPIVQGLGDACRAQGVPVLAPGRSCAALEWSKIFAKEVAVEAGILTPDYRVMPWSELRRALWNAVEADSWEGFGRNAPFVIKYDGLAAGKGVFLVRSAEDARMALTMLDAELESWRCLAPGPSQEARFLVEDMLEGEETSVIALCNDQEYRLLPFARDYKRRDDGQKGANTGGMGSVCPVPVGEGLRRQFAEIFERTLAAMRRRGLPYRGFLYAGCMVDAQGKAWLLEFNCRLGDPETQVMLPGLGRDFTTEVWRVAQGLPFWEPSRSGSSFEHDGRERVLVVAASPEYPAGSAPVRHVSLPPALPAGVAWAPAGVDSSGRTRAGRILGAVGEGASVAEARARAYGAIDGVRLEADGVVVKPHFRRDVGAEFQE